MADRYNIEHDKGTTLSLKMVIKDEAGDPVNLTGYVFSSQVRKKRTCELVVDLSCTVTNALGGEVEIILSYQDSENIETNCEPISYFFYDVESLFSGVKTRWLKGDFIVYNEATR